jgi:hypothetical protein
MVGTIACARNSPAMEAMNPPSHAAPKQTTAMAPAVMDGSRVPRASASVSVAMAWPTRQATAIPGWGGRYPETRATTAMASSDETTAYPAVTSDSPSQRPRTRSPRLMGRASIARAVPDSTSVAMAGAARNAPDIASTKLNMNAMITSTCEMPSVMRTSSMPESRAWATSWVTAQPTNTTLATDSPRSTHSSRRRSTSRRVSSAMTRMARMLTVARSDPALRPPPPARSPWAGGTTRSLR